MFKKFNDYKATKYSCYFAYVSASSVFSLPPILFLTFRQMYGISYTLLGTLVLINFCTQLIIDLIFSFFSKHFNITKTVRSMPLITSLGLFIYAIIPTIFPQFAYIGLVLGTIIFSVAAGLGEVLISPIVAAIPSEHPDRDMSRLHSLYGYGVLSVVLISSLFLKIFGTKNWMYLTLFFAAVPIITSILFSLCPIPDLNLHTQTKERQTGSKKTGLLLCALCIFLGSAAENTMTNWVSSFMENTLGISKSYSDIVGLATFAMLLALTRTLYAKFGKNISNVLLFGMIGAAFCYITAGISSNNILSLVACVLTGVFTSMLWPGTLILMEEKIPNPGVAAYALMAAGGDFGASIAPQALGIIVDKVSVSNWASALSNTTQLSTEQIGMRTGMLSAVIFPILGIIVLFIIKMYFRKEHN